MHRRTKNAMPRRFGAPFKTLVACAIAACAAAEAACGTGENAADDAGVEGGARPVQDASIGAESSTPNDASPSSDGDADSDVGAGDASAPVACETHYLDPSVHLAGLDDPQWYVDNIPFLDVPDADTGTRIQAIYYYRWSTLKRALRYTDSANGYVFLEFLEPPGYASAFGAVNAAAGHHLYESRWLHDLRYGDDYLNYWLNGAGKPGIREYSFWVADSAWARYEVSGDATFVQGLLDPLMKNYDAWGDHFDASMGLYWQVPVWDAMEYMADTYSTENPDKDPYHGGPGYRPTINAYQYADALAIAAIAEKLNGDTATATTYKARAAALVTAMQKNLWSTSSHFFVHKYREGGALFDVAGGREEIGFVPWQFNMPEPGYEATWNDTITNPNAFYTAFGPTTVAKDNPYYLNPYSRGSCCHWNGPLWPYSTTQTLKAMANLLNGYTQSYVTKADYFTLLANYAKSQFKNGEPYVAEALDPDDTQGGPIWAYDSPAHSEHYNHSGFVDPVITGLIGFHPRSDDVVEVSPLAPAAWNHFMLENVLYHGHYLTFVWDEDGTHYKAGAGLSVYQDCALLHRQAALGLVRVPLAHGSWAPKKPARKNNLFSNAIGGSFPKASASYTFSVDAIAQINDGITLYDKSVNGSPNDANVHNRWTNYSSPNTSDWIAIDLGAPASVSEVTIAIYDDGKGVTPPSAYSIATSVDGTNWAPVTHLQTTPAKPAAGPNTAQFDAVSTRYVRVTFPVGADCGKGSGCTGVSELEAWVNP